MSTKGMPVGPMRNRGKKYRHVLITAEGKVIDKFRQIIVARNSKRYHEKNFFMRDLKIIPIDEFEDEIKR